MRRNSLTPDINVTPLVDVVLVLLIIFMVVVPRIEAGQSVKLPEVSNIDKKSAQRTDSVVLTIGLDGTYFVDKKQVTFNDVKKTLQESTAQNHSQAVIVKADQETPYAKITQLFKLCQDLGLSGVTLQVEEKKVR